MLPKPFTYHRPEKLDDALALMARYGDDVCPYAGGTELLLAMKMHFADYGHFVDLKRIPALSAISQNRGTQNGETLTIGALATHAMIADNQTIRQVLPTLAALCGSIANPRVRTLGTIGGNLCFAEPRADPPVLLSALDARLHLTSTRGERTVPASQFITGALETIRAADEILTRIDIPIAVCTTRYERVVFGHRTVAGAAAVIANNTEMESRVWVGCVASRPSALPETEKIISADPNACGDDLKQAIAKDLDMLDIVSDEDARADYRRHLAETVVLRAVTAAQHQEVPA
jgi:aerobic carbon-monoxide dehydrogenase medium subunit